MNLVLFGNTNNYPYRLAVALREQGHDARLVVTQRSLLHRPEGFDRSLSSGYPSWIEDRSDLREEDFIAPTSRIGPVLGTLEVADAVILNHVGPSLSDFICRPAMVWLTGSDLDYFANFDSVSVRQRSWSPGFRRSAAARLHTRQWTQFVERQRSGILRADAVSYFHRGLMPSGDAILDGIGVDDSLRFFVYMTSEECPVYREPPSRAVPRVFCGTRLTWREPVPEGASPLDLKGTDVMLEGVAQHLRAGGAPLELRLVRKGLDVGETVALVARLGLDRHVTWLDEMSQSEFRNELFQADVVVDQLGRSVIGMAGLDAMSLGRPLIANARPEIWGELISEDSPVCHASSPQMVAHQLARLLDSARERVRIGKLSRKFAMEHLSPGANARECVARLQHPPA